MALPPFTLPEFVREERVRGGSDLLITSTDCRVVDGAEGNQGCEDSSSYSDNISFELNEAIDIDALIGSGHKRRKTSFGAGHINLSSKKEENVGTLSVRYVRASDKEFTDTKVELESVRDMYHKGVFTKHLAIMEMKVAECGAELTLEEERRITVETELRTVIAMECQEQVNSTLQKQEEALTTFKQQTSQNLLVALQKFKENLLLHTQVSCGFFYVRKVDFNALVDVDMSSLGFDVFNLFGSAWDSFIATWKNELFVKEKEASSTADMALFFVSNAVNSIPPSITGSITVASSTVEAVAPINADQGVGR
ncbi:hypothetical protein GOBAR_DD05681 [Gossypium barbadense]|nr:hypothetical protein GOBAR_DD05681 [Gossypium barbadense]